MAVGFERWESVCHRSMAARKFGGMLPAALMLADADAPLVRHLHAICAPLGICLLPDPGPEGPHLAQRTGRETGRYA